MTSSSASIRAERRAALLRVVTGRSGPVIPDAETWWDWRSLAAFEHVVPLLYHLVDHVPTDVEDVQREGLGEALEAAMARCVHLEHHLIEVIQRFDARGIRSAVLKGSATSHVDYPDPSWRAYNDLDVLIDPAHRPAAVEILEHAGWVQAYALPRDHEHYMHATTFAKDGVELDLHQRIARRALGLRVPTAPLLEDASSLEIAGAEVRVLDDADRLIHSCLHAVNARYPVRLLTTLTDVLVAAHRRPQLARAVLARAEQWRVRSIVERGVRDAYAAARIDLHPEWSAAMLRPIHHRDRLIDRAYATPMRRPVFEELAFVRLLDGWGHRWRYARGYLAPGPEHVARYGRSGVRAHARYLAGKLRPKR